MTEYICEKCNDTGKVQIHNKRSQEFSIQRCPVCNGVSVLAKDRLAAVEAERDQHKYNANLYIEQIHDYAVRVEQDIQTLRSELDAALARAEEAEKTAKDAERSADQGWLNYRECNQDRMQALERAREAEVSLEREKELVAAAENAHTSMSVSLKIAESKLESAEKRCEVLATGLSKVLSVVRTIQVDMGGKHKYTILGNGTISTAQLIQEAKNALAAAGGGGGE